MHQPLTPIKIANSVKNIVWVLLQDCSYFIDGNQVSISAEVKKEQDEKKDGSIIRSERYFGRQYRNFMPARDIDDSKAETKYNNGVLELNLPNKPRKACKQLKVS